MGKVTVPPSRSVSRELQGIYANVIAVSSPELLRANLAAQNDFAHLRHGLGLDGNLQLAPRGVVDEAPELITLAGRRVPVVSVHDGEAGLLDNIGSILGVRQEALAVRKFSKRSEERRVGKGWRCGRAQ